ncbi:MAG: dephospho-CoA kinase [Spirochaetales bacterium]
MSPCGQNRFPKRYIIGVAGPMAAGKNLVTDILAKQGFSVIDADKLGHTVLEQSKEAILSQFEDQAAKKNLNLINPDGSIHRKNLGSIVFANKKNLARHEAVMHPKMNEYIENQIRMNPDTSYVINAAILHKFTVITQCNIVLFVTAPFFLRLNRAFKRTKSSKLHILKYFFAQFKIFDKCKKLNADIYKVNNSGTQECLETDIMSIVQTCIERG